MRRLLAWLRRPAACRSCGTRVDPVPIGGPVTARLFGALPALVRLVECPSCGWVSGRLR